jgi:hypothetical protein
MPPQSFQWTETYVSYLARNGILEYYKLYAFFRNESALRSVSRIAANLRTHARVREYNGRIMKKWLLFVVASRSYLQNVKIRATDPRIRNLNPNLVRCRLRQNGLPLQSKRLARWIEAQIFHRKIRRRAGRFDREDYEGPSYLSVTYKLDDMDKASPYLTRTYQLETRLIINVTSREESRRLIKQNIPIWDRTVHICAIERSERERLSEIKWRN